MVEVGAERSRALGTGACDKGEDDRTLRNQEEVEEEEERHRHNHSNPHDTAYALVVVVEPASKVAEVRGSKGWEDNPSEVSPVYPWGGDRQRHPTQEETLGSPNEAFLRLQASFAAWHARHWLLQPQRQRRPAFEHMHAQRWGRGLVLTVL